MALPIYVTDTEIFPNFYLAVVINFTEYCAKCKELDKVPIFDKADIVATVGYKAFKLYVDPITLEETDDLMALLSFLTTPMFLISFNGQDYDNVLFNYLLSSSSNIKHIGQLIHNLHTLSGKVISYAHNNIQDEYVNMLKWYKVIYHTIDVQKVFALDKAMKSLKQTLININWYSILDYDMPLIEADEDFVYPPICNSYAEGEELENVRFEFSKRLPKWDRVVFPKHLAGIEAYCFNDTAGTAELSRMYLSEISIRIRSTVKYNINLLSTSRSKLADNIFIKRYADLAGMTVWEMRRLKPIERNRFNLKDCIPTHFRFTDPAIQTVYDFFYRAVATEVDDINLEFPYKGTIYTFAKGGLHSKDAPGLFRTTEDSYIIDVDGNSYYPVYAVNNRIGPGHLKIELFIKAVSDIIEERLALKKINKEDADILKIVINSGVFGKLGFKFSPFYDRLAMFGVTIGCQLSIFMLVEAIEAIEPIGDLKCHVISANTDGLVSIVPKKLFPAYHNAVMEWGETIKMGVEFTFYDLYVRRDVNNYFSVKSKSKLPLEARIKYKGDLNPNLFKEELTKGYDAPIIAIAIKNYYLYETPIMDTLYASTRIEEFLMTTKPDQSYSIVVYEVVNGILTKSIITANNRYYVSNSGVIVCKCKSDPKLIMKSDSIMGSRIIANQYLTLYNQAFKKEEMQGFNIKYGYYYERVVKVIHSINLNTPSKMKKKAKYIKSNLGNYNLFDENANTRS